MHSVHAEMWDPQPLSKHASPLPPRPPSNSRPAHVTTATPAKRITFYKSGDSQFGGVKMAIHKRSFKCFDALLDDLSQKVPLPFGVRTVTTPRGIHAIKHLEQLQDGGCYLCSDRRQAKPVNMELAGKRPSVWYHHSRRPQRPESSSATPPGHFSYRQRRILLLKNSEPGMRRTVVLSRRSTRSLGAFLDDVSEVMQFHVRKLYTAEGRRIDSVQSLMTCPGVLVCVGREAFSPMLVNFIRKSSEEKLPGLGSRTPGNGARSPATQGARSPPHGAQSRSSEYSEVHESKKNVNFGLETKKSIIHPRSDSSNRSNRFSLSSEKSYGNGVGAYSQGRSAIMNDDIEKRVLVNKDGSLSVEMRVRFRLHNDETLQWSTQMKKSPSLTNECCPLNQAQPHYLQQGQSESCSDPDSTSYEREGANYSSQPRMEGNQCPCCYQRQEQQYDLWENPAHCHKHPPVPPPHTSSHTHTITRHTHSSSSSSSCNSRRVVRCRAQVGGCSETGQMLQEEMFVTEQVERRVEVEQDGDTHVEVCRVSRGCSHSEVVAIDTNVQPLSRKSVEEVFMEEERPLSAISSSSHVLQSLKEDQDDDLPPSVSQCCNSIEPSPTSTSQTLDDKPARFVISAGSVHSTEHKEDREERGSRAASAASSCHCGAATAEAEDRAPSSMSKMSSGSRKAKIPNSEEEMAADDENDERISSSLSGISLQSKATSVCSNCGGCKPGVNSDSYSRASKRSHHSHRASPTPPSSRENTNTGSDGDGSEGSAGSTKSNRTNLTNNSRYSAISNIRDGRESSATSNHKAAGKEEERTTSATSHRSYRSHKSGCNGSTCVAAGKEKERSPSAMSAQSNMSAKSHNSNCTAKEENTRARSSLSDKCGASAKTSASVKMRTDTAVEEEEDTNKRTPSVLSVKSSKAQRPDSVLSAKSNVSAKSGTSHRSTCSHCARPVSAGAKDAEPEATGEEEGIEAEERAASAMSAKSNLSDKSNKSRKSSKAPERSLSPRSGTGEDEEERAASQVSVKSNVSVKSSKSCKANGKERVESPSSEEKEKENVKDDQQRPESVISAKSASPAMADRTSSAMSRESHTSAKSSKSQKSNRAAASLNPNEADIPIETNGKEEQNENQERVASSMSVKSKSSARSRTSNKPSKNLKPVSPSPNVVTIKTPEGLDEEGNDTTERAPSAASAKSGTSNVSTKSNHNRTAVIEPADENVVEKDVPRSKSQGQMLSPRTHSRKAASPRSPHVLPGLGVGETRGPSALSVHSTKSAKSGKSKCGCGDASALEKAKKEQEEEKNEEDEEMKSEEASERAASISSTKRQRRESGGTEQTLSRNSFGSVSLGLPEDQEAADSDSDKSSVSFVINTEKKGREKTATPQGTGSIVSQKSTRKCPHHRLAVDIPTINTPGGSEVKDEEGGEQTTERGASALSAKSSSRSHKSSCNCGVKEAVKGAVNDLEMDASDNRTSSAMSSASAKVRSISPARAKKARDSGDNDTENQATSRPASKAKGEEGIADNKAASVHSKSAFCLRPESAVSALSGSKVKASKESRGDGSVKAHKAKSSGSVKSSNSQKTNVKAPSPCLSHSSKPCSIVETHSKSTLSHSLSAADLLKETMAAARPHSRHTKESKASERCLEMSPACLPNASPNEVVSDWLRSMPNSMLLIEPNDEEGEQDEVVEKKPGEDEESPEEEKGGDEEEKVEAEEKEEEAAESADPAPGDAVEASSRVLSGDTLPRSLNSSAAVMKVLLSSSLGRCQSLPEVSPVYGRRLSTSARGLLDCLAQLQLIEPAVSPGHDQQKDANRRYEDIMVILQSLWLTEQAKDVGKEQVTPPRSSSGLGMSSGSGGSGKENVNQGEDETKQNKTKETALHEEEGAEKVVKEEGNAEAAPEETGVAEEPVQSEEHITVPPCLDSPKTSENPSSTDKSSANDSSKSPTDNERDTLEDSSSGTPPTVVRAPLSKRLSQDPDPVWVLHLLKKVEKQFMNHYITAMAEFKVRWDLDDSLILDTMIGELRDEVSRRIQGSIQREVKKIQSRAGRGERSPRPPQRGNLSRESTMTERRRRILKVMKIQSVKTDPESQSDGELGEFSDQRSEEEYCPCDACVRKKMAERPLKENLGTEAPVIMEFDLLKILQLKKSPLPLCAVVPQTAEEEGDSEVAADEGRSLEVVQEEEEEEDETQEDIVANIVLEETIPEEVEEEDEVGEKEQEETQKEESSAGDEEQEEGETGGEEAGETSENGEEEEEAECQCQCAGNEEESDKAEEGEEETAEGEDAEETNDDTGEGETGEEEEGENAEEEEESGSNEGETGSEEKEESDKETVKEATAGESTESGEDEEVSEFKEEEETTGRESREEEASGETEQDNAAKNEEEGNVSASAEEEDDGEGDSHEEESGEQGAEASEEERASSQCQRVAVTEGEEADGEDSDMDVKRPSDTSADESGQEVGGGAGHEEEKEDGGDAVEEFKPEEKEVKKRKDGALLHQFTKSSVESQPGSLEDVVTDSPHIPVISIEVPKMAAGGGTGQRRSRSPGRVKCRKHKECDVDLDNF